MNDILQHTVKDALYQKYGEELSDFSMDPEDLRILFTLPLRESLNPTFHIEIAFQDDGVSVCGALPVNRKRYTMLYRLKESLRQRKEDTRKYRVAVSSYPLCFYDAKTDAVRTEIFTNCTLTANPEIIVKNILKTIQEVRDCFHSLDERTVYYAFFAPVHIRSIRDLTEDRIPFFE